MEAARLCCLLFYILVKSFHKANLSFINRISAAVCHNAAEILFFTTKKTRVGADAPENTGSNS